MSIFTKIAEVLRPGGKISHPTGEALVIEPAPINLREAELPRSEPLAKELSRTDRRFGWVFDLSSLGFDQGKIQINRDVHAKLLGFLAGLAGKTEHKVLVVGSSNPELDIGLLNGTPISPRTMWLSPDSGAIWLKQSPVSPIAGSPPELTEAATDIKVALQEARSAEFKSSSEDTFLNLAEIEPRGWLIRISPLNKAGGRSQSTDAWLDKLKDTVSLVLQTADENNLFDLFKKEGHLLIAPKQRPDKMKIVAGAREVFPLLMGKEGPSIQIVYVSAAGEDARLIESVNRPGSASGSDLEAPTGVEPKILSIAVGTKLDCVGSPTEGCYHMASFKELLTLGSRVLKLNESRKNTQRMPLPNASSAIF